MLDGSNSSGANLQYFWTSENGANTANPVVSGFGNYILNVIDQSGFADIDAITVGKLTFAPVAQDDYDSAVNRSEIEIYVLDNDYDPENNIDPMALSVTIPPGQH